MLRRGTAMGNNPDPPRNGDARARLREAQLAWEKACNDLLEASSMLSAARADLRQALEKLDGLPAVVEAGRERS
jgi:hypothetical protein